MTTMTLDNFIKEYSRMILSPVPNRNGVSFVLTNNTRITFENTEYMSKESANILAKRYKALA
jgi:hypothetical protein